MQKYVLGIDVGGTNIKLGLVNPRGRVISRTNLATKSFIRNKKKLVRALLSEIKFIIQAKKLSKKNLVGIGIGLPGAVNNQKGIVHYLTNISGWRNVPLKKIIEKEIHIPTFLDNDVNCVTLGEWKYGSGRGISNLICLTLGTGVGGGLILNGAIYRGEGFAAGEAGHMPLNEEGEKCNCGGYACLETAIGNQYLLKKAQKIFKQKNPTLENITFLAAQGNPKAIRFWKETAGHLGRGLIGVVNLLNPRLIVIGGGTANAHRFMFREITRIIKCHAMKQQSKMAVLKKATLGNDAGIIGAQVLVKDALGIKS
ncbi:MAG: ROK family protein [Candidatus Omnitrophota bacterium]